MTILDAVPPEDRRSRLFSLGLRPCPLRTEIPPDSLNLLIMLCTVEGEISKSLPIFLWGTLFLNISIIFSRICWQTGDPRPIFAPKGLDLSWMLLLYQIIITITCWHQLFQITSLFNQFTSLLALNCSCPNFFWNVLQVWMTGKDVYLQMTWSWPDKTWNILCSYCLQWNTSQSKFRNHYFLFLFAFPNFFWFGVVHQVILTEYYTNVILTTWLSILHLVCEQWHKDFSFWWHWYVHWHKYLLLRDELKILSKLQAFAGNPLCGAVCTNCFEKCTYFFANIKDDSRNAPKRLKKKLYYRFL